MKHLVLVLPLAALFITSSAFARDPEAQPTLSLDGNAAERAERAKTSWYGYQAVIADVAVIGLTAGGGAQALTESYCFTASCVNAPRRDHTASEALLGTAAVTFLFAAPTIHALHGQWGKAAASLGLRALPVAIAVPLMSDPRPHDSTWPIGAAVLLTGGLAAMIVDDAVLARGRVNHEPVTKPPSRVLSVAPTFDPRGGGRGGGVSAVGTF